MEALVKTLYHDWINLSQLSQFTVDMGTLTAGTVRDKDSKMILNLEDKDFVVKDKNDVVRIRIGKLERGSTIEWETGIEWTDQALTLTWAGARTGYGLEIYNSSGILIYRAGIDTFPELTWWTE